MVFRIDKHRIKVAKESYRNLLTECGGKSDCTWCTVKNIKHPFCETELKRSKPVKLGRNLFSQEKIRRWLDG